MVSLSREFFTFFDGDQVYVIVLVCDITFDKFVSAVIQLSSNSPISRSISISLVLSAGMLWYCSFIGY